MKSKIVNLFDKQEVIIPNTDKKYSELLESFLEPFIKDFKDMKFYEDIIEFGINAWNSANLKATLPKDLEENPFDDLENTNTELLNRMMDYKLSHFKEYTNFIVDYELEETTTDPILKITTQEQNSFLQSIFDTFESEDEQYSEEDFDENYINRSAITITPRQPFIDWHSQLRPDATAFIKNSNTYLIPETYDNQDIEAWLRKKFDTLFTSELEAWHTNKKEWPQKRNYKMFQEWFQIELSATVYDFVKEPIYKG